MKYSTFMLTSNQALLFDKTRIIRAFEAIFIHLIKLKSHIHRLPFPFIRQIMWNI
jgi:hypothetical protein